MLGRVWAWLLTSLLFLPSGSLAQEEGDDVVIGKYHEIHSNSLNEDRLIMVHLPNGYERGDKRFPVLYVLGADVWSSLAASGATMESLGFEQIPPMIVVGVPGSTSARYTRPVTPDGGPGGAELYCRFIREELVPFVDENYRTESFRVLFGQSNAGLFATYVFLSRPDAFDAYIVSSPTLGWNIDYMNDKARKLLSENPSLEKFFFMVYGEKDYEELVLDAIPSFEGVLKTHAPPGLTWSSTKLEKEGHVPVSGLARGLLALFPDYLIPDAIKSNGLDAVDGHYAALSKRYRFPISTPEEVLFNMAFQLRSLGALDDAIVHFRVLLERYPSSWRGHFFLGETYLDQGDVPSAVVQYRKTLELRPDTDRAKERLAALEEKEPK